MSLLFSTFVRKPFTVEAVEVTEENLKEIAQLVGQIQKGPNGVRYIEVNQKKIPNVTRVEVGYWVTRMGSKIRAYSANAFAKEFVSNTPEVWQLVEDLISGKEVANG